MQKKTLSYLLFAHISLKCIWIWPDTTINNDGTGWFLPKVNYFSAFRFP